MEDKKKAGVTRRDFIKGTALGAGAAAVAASGVLSSCATMGGAHRGNSPIFQPTKIGSLTLKNKMIRAAMGERRHDANFNPTPDLLRMYEEEAAGGSAMIITGLIGVSREDHYGPRFGGFYEASQIPAFRAAADAAHKNGAKICAQLALHGNAVAFVPNVVSPYGVATISREDIRRGANAFAQAVVRARDAGFDAIEFHFAHGYLLARFWAHYLNTRTDEYGGSAENRARFAFEVVEATRRAVGGDFPLLAKINANEHLLYPGSSQEETNYLVQGLKDRGVDAVEISGAEANRWRVDGLSKEDHNFFSRDARNIAFASDASPARAAQIGAAKSVDIPLILTGGVRNVEMMEEALKFNSKLVGFGMARPILSEPDLPNKWAKNTNYEPKCITCNWCITNLFGETDKARCVLYQNRA